MPRWLTKVRSGKAHRLVRVVINLKTAKALWVEEPARLPSPTRDQ